MENNTSDTLNPFDAAGLTDRALAIRDAVHPKSVSATDVGSLFHDIVAFCRDVHGFIERLAGTTIPQLRDEISAETRSLREQDISNIVRFLAHAHPESAAALASHLNGAQIAAAFSPEEIKHLFPDIVAICEPGDGWFMFGKHSGNNHRVCSAAVQCENGMLLRKDCPEGLDFISVWSAEKVHYANLAGYKRFGIAHNLNEEGPAGTPHIDEVARSFGAPLRAQCLRVGEIRGCVNMGGLQSMNFTFSVPWTCRIHGDWSEASNVYSWYCTFGHWDLPGSGIAQLPAALPTAQAEMTAAFVNCHSIRRFPDIDLQNNSDWMTFAAYRKEQDDTSPVHARIKNIGRKRTNPSGLALNLLRAWDYDDMVYSLITASVHGDSVMRLHMHPDAIARLTQADRALVSEKNITLVASKYIS